MPQSFSFRSCLRTGKIGVEETTRYLQSLPSTLDVLSLEADRRFFSWGLDLLWIRFSESGFRTESVEVKTDTWDTGNLYLEIVANEEKEKPGWLFTSRADWVAYHIIPLRFLALLDLSALRQWYLASPYTEKRYHKRTWTRTGEGGYRSIGVPCPASEILAEVPHLLRPPVEEVAA